MVELYFNKLIAQGEDAGDQAGAYTRPLFTST
jgi:hypothetical protein